MRRVMNLAAALIVSPELIVVLVVVAFLLLTPAIMADLGVAIRADAEVWKYLPALTLIFSGSAIGSSFKIRAPLENFSNKALYQWPGYQLLVDRVYVGLFYGICSAGASLALWIVGQRLSPELAASIFLAATLVSAVTALTMVLAQQKLRELLDAN